MKLNFEVIFLKNIDFEFVCWGREFVEKENFCLLVQFEVLDEGKMYFGKNENDVCFKKRKEWGEELRKKREVEEINI